MTISLLVIGAAAMVLPASRLAPHLGADFWQSDPGSASASGIDPALADPQADWQGQYDPCWWGGEGCDTLTEAEPAYLALDRPELLEVAPPVVPCLTTTDGCTLDAYTGIRLLATDVTAGQDRSPSEEASLDPCFWDSECFVFGT